MTPIQSQNESRIHIISKSNRCCLKSNFWEGESTADWVGGNHLRARLEQPHGWKRLRFSGSFVHESDDVSGSGTGWVAWGEDDRARC